MEKNVTPNVVPSWPEFNPTTSTNGTFMLTSNISGSFTFRPNVVLIIAGGTFTGSGTMTGDNTTIIAAPTLVFSGTFTFAGTWKMEKVYAENFGDTNSSNSAPAINKAIIFSNASGAKVQLLAKDYVVTESIIFRGGTTLEGTIKGIHLPLDSKISKYGTTISTASSIDIIKIETTGTEVGYIDCYRFALKRVTLHYRGGGGNAININATGSLTPRQGVIEDIGISYLNASGYNIRISGGSYIRIERVSTEGGNGIILANTTNGSAFQEYIWMKQLALSSSSTSSTNACITINKGNNIYISEVDANDAPIGVYITNPTTQGVYSIYCDRISTVRCGKGIWVRSDQGFLTRIFFTNTYIFASKSTDLYGIYFSKYSSGGSYHCDDVVFDGVSIDHSSSSFYAIYDENAGLNIGRFLNVRTTARCRLSAGKTNNQITFTKIRGASQQIVALSGGVATIQLSASSTFPGKPIVVASLVDRQVPISVETTNALGGVSNLLIRPSGVTSGNITVNYSLTGFYTEMNQ